MEVSVIVPTRDRAVLLATTLRSVLWQRDVDLEVIVVDDGSIDATSEVVSAAADARVSLLRLAEPGGPSVARNLGADRANGEWLAFVDDDDVWAPDKLAHQLASAERAGREWVYVGAVNVDDDLSIVFGRPPISPEEVVAALPRSNPIPGGGSNAVVRRSALAEVGGFDERFSPCEDWELWARLARRGPPASVPEPLMGYRVHAGGRSRDVDAVVRAARRIEQEYATTLDWGKLHRWLAENRLRQGRHLQALSEFARAAVRGQAAGVASDLVAIARRRVARIGGRSADRNRPVDGWAADATVWLRELERSPAAGTDEAPDR